MEAQELKVEYEPTDQLVTYVNNAKVHTATQVDQIKRSIEEFGFNDPVAVWTNSEGKSEIVEGHGRLLAAQELGIEELPVIHLDRLTDEQRRAYTHVHNQLTINTGFDLEILAGEIEDMPQIDWSGYGFQEEPVEDSYEEIEQEVEPQEKAECADTFDVLFVCHGQEDEERLASLLGLEMPLKARYEYSEVSVLCCK